MSIIHLAKEEKMLKFPEEDDVMEEILEHLGGMGTYQRWLFLMMMPFGVCFSFLYSVQMFAAATPQAHWCRVPELMHLDIDLRRNLSIPGAWQGEEWDRCAMFAANWTRVLQQMRPPAADAPTQPCRDGWEFLHRDIPYPTVVSERGWVCDKASYGPWAQAIFFVGSMVGGIIFGWMGDRFGRVPALIGANVVGCIGGIGSAFTNGLWDFIVCRFLAGMANDCCFMMIYLIVLEYAGGRHRSWASNMSIAVYCGLGSVLLAALALWIPDWRWLFVATSLPMLLALAAPCLVPESARWLASTGRINRAVKVLRRFERVNNTKIPDEVLQKFITSSSRKSESDESMGALVRSGPMRRSVGVLVAVTIASSIVLDAVLRLSASIGDSFYLTFALSSIAELPALTLVALLLDRSGRRLLTSVTLTAGGALSLACAAAPAGAWRLACALGVRFAVNMALAVETQLAAELLPTGLRALGSSLVHMTVFLATTLSPFVVYSGSVWRGLPLVILGALGLAGGGAALLLPETRGRSMPQTIADGERLVRETALWGKPAKDEPEVLFMENKSLNKELNR